MDASAEIEYGRIVSEAKENLAAALETVFAAFSNYKKPPAEACIDAMCGPVPDAARAAWGKSLRQYTQAEFEDFSRHSRCLIQGSYDGWNIDFVQYLKFWLPRYLQGLADGSCPDYILTESLAMARWQGWPQPEADALRHWCKAWLAACLVAAAKPIDVIMGDRRAANSLSFSLDIGADVIAVLYTALRIPSPCVLTAVKGIVEEFAPTLIRKQEVEADATETGRLKRELARWMLAPSTKAELESAFFQVADDDAELAQIVSRALEWIEIVRNAYTADPAGWQKWLTFDPSDQ